MSEAIDPIVAQAVTFTYGRRPVLDQVTFHVPAGRFFIIIGPNGSGKSTLLKILAGLLRPQKGEVTLLGRPLKDYSRRQVARKVAYVPQSTPFNFPFTVAQVALMGRAPHLGWPPLESKADHEAAREAMAFTGVDHLARRRIGEISGGEQQRAFLARALCQDPEVLLLDEPTAALDLHHQLHVMDLLERLIKIRNITVIMVSHDLNLAAMYAQRVLLMAKGAAARIGAPEAVLQYDLLEAVYDCPLVVDQSPLGDYPRIHLVPQRHLDRHATALPSTHQET